MKKIAIQSFVSLISGGFLALGFFTVFHLLDRSAIAELDAQQRVLNPDGIEIVSSEIKPNEINLIITGKVRNTDVREWSLVGIEAKIFAGQAQVNKCLNAIHNVALNSERYFEIRCLNASGSNLPENLNYKLKITNGSYF